MYLKNKMIVAALCALIAGIGIFGAPVNTTSAAVLSLDQIEQMIANN